MLETYFGDKLDKLYMFTNGQLHGVSLSGLYILLHYIKRVVFHFSGYPFPIHSLTTLVVTMYNTITPDHDNANAVLLS